MCLKYTLLIQLAFITSSSISFSQSAEIESQNIFHLKGYLVGNSTKFIVLFYTDSNAKSVTDTCFLINHQFNFSGYIKEPSIAYLTSNLVSNSSNTSNSIQIFIEPKEMKMNIKENCFNSAKVYGSLTQNEYDSLKRMELPIRKQIQPLTVQANIWRDSISFFLKRGDTISASKIVEKRNNLIHIDMKPYVNETNNIEKKFIINNPNSYLSAYLLYKQFNNHYLTSDSVWPYFNKFSFSIQNSYWGKETKTWLGNILPVSSTFPIIHGVNEANKEVSSDNLLGKDNYSLIIFWASWCIPCRQLSPTYSRIFRKFHSKGVKFIAITWDNDKRSWLDAIKKDNTLSWVHIYPDDSRNVISNTYGLSSIPAEILLKGNKVIAKYSGADNEHSNIKDLENKLKEIFHD